MLKLIQTKDSGNNLGILAGYGIFTDAIMLCRRRSSVDP